jgi:hypothetical protein
LNTSVDYLTGIEDVAKIQDVRIDHVAYPKLVEVVEAARQRIAQAFGLPLRCIRISIDPSELTNKLPEGDDLTSE